MRASQTDATTLALMMNFQEIYCMYISTIDRFYIVLKTCHCRKYKYKRDRHIYGESESKTEKRPSRERNRKRGGDKQFSLEMLST